MKSCKLIISLIFVLCGVSAYGQTADEYRIKAEKGDANSQYLLALLYCEGTGGVKKDYAQANVWFKRAAENGHTGAQYCMGLNNINGYGALQDFSEAFVWFKKAADGGFINAYNNLGYCYGNGIGVEKDLYQCFTWYQKAGELGDVTAQFNIGNMYYRGEGTTKDLKQAMHWWEKAAKQGDKDAQNSLGNGYEQGFNGFVDMPKAIYWWKNAAEQGDSNGQYSLAKCYYYGNGVSQDYAEAVRLFRGAASQDKSAAQYFLGMCYQFGQGLGKDLSKAIFWYEKARQEIGTADLYYNLACCYRDTKNIDNALIYANLAVNADMQAKYLELSGNLYLSKNDMDYALEIWHELKTKYPECVNDTSEFCDAMLAYEKKIEKSIDYNIPTSSTSSTNTFAFVIANENYKRVAQVPYAKNDGDIFAEYCKKTLGIPEKNVKVWIDASLGDMQYAISKIQQTADAYDGDASIIFYYAGHGIPSDDQQNSFLLPIDGYNADESSIPLHELYRTLGKLNTKSTLVILDACFSGAQRNGEMLASTRGVAIKPKQDNLEGNLIVLSAAQGDETALPYNEMKHGLFSYFLLKKLRESEGNCTIGELSDYITTNVKRTSISIGDKLQTPKVSAPATMSNWRDIMLK